MTCADSTIRDPEWVNKTYPDEGLERVLKQLRPCWLIWTRNDIPVRVDGWTRDRALARIESQANNAIRAYGGLR